MIIWIKEFTNLLTLESFSLLTKSGLSIFPFVSFDVISANDVLIISKADDTTNIYNSTPCNVLIFEEIFEKIIQNIYTELNYNYDYYYLKNALKSAKNETIETIITGSSYSLFGIEQSLLSNEINCSLASQDLYYSALALYNIYEENRNIKNVVLFASYYYFFSDLSKTQNIEELSRVSKVYYPLFSDLHNSVLLPSKQNLLYNSEIFDMQKLINMYALDEYKRGYFNKLRPRKNFATKLSSNPQITWSQYSTTEKISFAKERALKHNNNLHRTTSLQENITTFKCLSKFCSTRNINLIVLVPPATSFYRSFLDANFKDIFYEVLYSIEEPIHLLDLYDSEYFTDEDFNDMDHLGDNGAIKLTNELLELLSSLS